MICSFFLLNKRFVVKVNSPLNCYLMKVAKNKKTCKILLMVGAKKLRLYKQFKTINKRTIVDLKS